MTQIPDDIQGLRSLNALGSDEIAVVCGTYVRNARDFIYQGFQRGEGIRELLLILSGAFDSLIAALFRRVKISSSTFISIVAQGGYGRRELFPYSDLDLLILYDGGEDEISTRLVEQVIYPLWDAKVSVGYSVRGLDETLALAEDDLTVCTALLDGRIVAGNEGPFHALEAAAMRRFFGQQSDPFLARLREEQAARHQKFGETVFLLEPNIKLGKGGLRDLTVGLWAAKARMGLEDWPQLTGAGIATTRQVNALLEAMDFLQRLRMAMHLHAKRNRDHLLFELQEVLAPRLFPESEMLGGITRSAAVAPTVERLMRAYYRHARTVVIETEGILERSTGGLPIECVNTHPITEDADEHFATDGRLLISRDPKRFWERPSEILRAFMLALKHRLRLDRATRDALAEAAAEEPGEQLMADPEAARLWMALLCDPEQEGAVTLLEEMHLLGVINALIPEFEPCTGRIQHDLYHVYTVDLHSLNVVGLLKAWRRGEMAQKHPTAVALMESVEGMESLLLAALLHDVGKPLGHGHAAKGARLAAGVVARLGLSERIRSAVTFLVEQHLTMAHLSQRRDLSDPLVIKTLADEVREVDLLRQLYLLTLADTAETAPGNLTKWKVSLLDDLYMRTYVYLTHGEGVEAEEREQLIQQKRDALELVLRRAHGEEASLLVSRAPNELVLTFSVEDLVHHLKVALDLESALTEGSLQKIRTRAHANGTSEVTICCQDAPGRLAAITGVMRAHSIEILAAQVFTLESLEQAGHASPAIVLDVFNVRSRAEDHERLWAAFEHDLNRVLGGNCTAAEMVARATQRSGLPPRILPRVESIVSVDNAISERLTVLDIQAPDREGLLFAITQALSLQRVTIHLSKVATEAGRVVDIFYISDQQSGGKIIGEDRLEQIRRAILSAIDALE